MGAVVSPVYQDSYGHTEKRRNGAQSAMTRRGKSSLNLEKDEQRRFANTVA